MKRLAAFLFIILVLIQTTKIAQADVINNILQWNTNYDASTVLFDPSLGTLNNVSLEGTIHVYLGYHLQTQDSDYIQNLSETFNVILSPSLAKEGGYFLSLGHVSGSGVINNYGNEYASGQIYFNNLTTTIASEFDEWIFDSGDTIVGAVVYENWSDVGSELDNNGDLWVRGGYNYSGNLNISYDYTPSQHESVPEPATMLLLGTGLVGLAGFRRRKSKK